MVLVGIDWADDHHDVCLVDETCLDPSASMEAFRIEHSAKGFERLHAKLREYESDPAQILVALETPHGLLVHELLRRGYQVYAINPKSVNRYKDRHTPSSAKDDKRDALALAHILRTDRHGLTPLQMLPDDYRLLDELCQDLRQMIADKTRLMNRLTGSLKEYYPQAVGLFSEIDSPISTAFLKAFPAPDALLAASSKKFAAFFSKQRYPCPKRVPELFEKVQTPCPKAEPVIARAARMRMLALVDQLITIRVHVADYEQQIQALFQNLPDNQNLPTLPGVGERLAPELAATLGPRPQDSPTRFATKHQLSRLGGCAPLTRQSGNYKHVSFRRACNKGMRRMLRDWAQASLSESRWARAFYDYHKSQGHRHETILRSLAGKHVSILHKLWRTGEAYDEERHIKQLKARNIIWAIAL